MDAYTRPSGLDDPLALHRIIRLKIMVRLHDSATSRAYTAKGYTTIMQILYENIEIKSLSVCNLWYCLPPTANSARVNLPTSSKQSGRTVWERFVKQTTLQPEANRGSKWIKCVGTHLYGNELIASELWQQEGCDHFKYCTNHKRKSAWVNLLSMTTESQCVVNDGTCKGTFYKSQLNLI